MSRAPASKGGRSRAAEEEQSRREGRSRAEDVPWSSPRRGSRKQAARASGPRARWSMARDEPGVRSPGSRGSSSGSGDPAGGREMEARTGTTSFNSNGGGGHPPPYPSVLLPLAPIFPACALLPTRAPARSLPPRENQSTLPLAGLRATSLASAPLPRPLSATFSRLGAAA